MSGDSMAPLRILILSDGRPGHFNLSEGIAAAIERLGPAETSRLEIRRGRWPGALLASLTRARLPAPAMLTAVYGVRERDVAPSDVIVSAGAETLAASVWLARARGVPNIFYGSLRLFEPLDFALVLTSYAANAERPRHALALKPSRLDPDTLPLVPDLAGTKAPTLGLLIGGDAGPIRYTQADWNQLVMLIRNTAAQHGVRWLLANSRRTPAAVSDKLAQLAAAPGTHIADFLDVRTAGPGTLPALLARCHGVLCTADSSSMLSECVWIRRPTLALTPANFTLDNNEQSYRDWLIRSGWCAQLPLSQSAPDVVVNALRAVQPLRENPLDRISALLNRRLSGLGPRDESPVQT